MQLLHLPINYYLIAFVFFATLCSYNFHYILAAGLGNQKLSIRLLYKRHTSFLILIAGAAGAVFFFNSAHILIMNVFVAVLFTLVYSMPLLPFAQLDFAKRAGFLKTMLLAFTWTFVTAYFPLAQHGLQFTTSGILILAKRFLFMLMLCIIFDNRDVNVDKIHGLHSLATDLSPKTMRWLIGIVFALLFVLNFFLGRQAVSYRQVAALQLSALITLVIYFFSRKKQDYFFYYFIVDGMMVLMVLLTTVASI
jgi:4-hydroxybenzoate polyprenyltransferase